MNSLDYGSREACQKLFEKGIVVETEAVWAFVPGNITKPNSPGKWDLIPKPLYPFKKQYPALSMADAWRMLPDSVEDFYPVITVDEGVTRAEYRDSLWHLREGYCCENINPTDALIELIIWLTERGKEKGDE